MVSAIIKEVSMRRLFLEDGEEIKSIYFGGGTPSVLNLNEVESILNEIKLHFKISKYAEVSFECNPDDLSTSYLKGLWQLGVNRLSIGVQSFDDNILTWMNRSHNNKQTQEAIAEAAKIGYQDITIDLIYGVPQLGVDQWKKTVKEALQLPINHLSAYSLTLEENTPYNRLVNQKKYEKPDDDLASQHYEILIDEIIKNGWNHYEVSNFCKEENYSKHNTSYWQNKHYLGLGPAAHSYNGTSRFWNISNNKKYIEIVESEQLAYEEEELTKANRYNEHVLTGLRTKWGVNLKSLKEEYGVDVLEMHADLLKEWDGNNWIIQNQDNLSLTESGLLFADYISSELFVEE
jgi:oxygen-independent coproporphyrinogen-3 oxidase